MQRLVYIMVEGLLKNECERRAQFYQLFKATSKKALVDKVKDMDRVANFVPFKPEDPISISLEYYVDAG